MVYMLWSNVTCYGHVLWSRVMVTCYGHVLWSRVMVTCYGHVLWSRVMVTCYGHVLWSRVMVTCYGHVQREGTFPTPGVYLSNRIRRLTSLLPLQQR